MSVGQGQHAPPPAPPPKPKLLDGDGATNTDTASRRSISQKRSMFEGDNGKDETVESVDPAMLSIEGSGILGQGALCLAYPYRHATIQGQSA